MDESAFPHRFRATSESLEVARKIAEALGAALDPESTRRAADELHGRYFSEIKGVVGQEIDTASFRSGSRYRVNAFVPIGSKVVHFDEILDYWLFICCHLTTIAACKQLSGEQYESLVDHFLSALDMTRNAHIHRSLRDKIFPLLLDHADCLELSHALSRSMIVFIICHECAHVSLGHTGGRPCPEKELEADATAAKYFRRIVQANDSAGSIFVSHKLACAPILLFRFFGLAESRRFTETSVSPSRASHPSPNTRLEQLASELVPRLSEKTRYVHDGFIAALADIERLAELRRPPE